MLPSGPSMIPRGLLFAASGYSLMASVVVLILPMLLAVYSVNHMYPPGPSAMLRGPLADPAGRVYSVMVPPGVISPILPALYSVNQMLPSGPRAIPFGWLLAVGTL